ncbi:2-amino-4-hydroxy-6-hydroxymethyldihydropteridine pyrophosphokinase [Nitrosococcus halophilus Nc 4]|uniref:2-amino-4-hydroxy-6-hydroxymethyldihydropteridine diphosphokinase n=1 Tax=Nitrosococcus halophilus (strain Nc4) TaxID=472759 RepID=D5C463_NITHN|nr:2-amino-4-hydroxy-6-hydroxymethyldihydropteridine diphosphokinase [Nitrosococcus halophilus]ADE13251.1 2-amino-4-hydroxy-6-hydroxymethyldihydropteridine pyrophosphokinase [Nitrosococcus halophilus Nc 4]
MARAYVSIGSNINRENNIRAGVDALRRRYGPLIISRVFESESVGFQGDNFYNLVVGFDTNEPPQTIAHALHEIERACGRKRGGPRFAPRALDLDLLLYNDLVIDEPGLQIPRDDILNYAFVLQPLAEIAPRCHHPVLGKSYAELWATFDKSSNRLWPTDLKL